MKIQEEGQEQQIPRSLHRALRGSSFGRNDRNDVWTQKWGQGWALAGAAAWAGVAVLARMGIARIGVIELLFLFAPLVFAPLVIVPLGMELGRVRGFSSGSARELAAAAQTLQPLGAVLAVVAVCLAPGKRAGFLAGAWMVVCGIMASAAVVELGALVLGPASTGPAAEIEKLTGEAPVATRVVPVSTG